jgi:hypothetical protein
MYFSSERQRGLHIILNRLTKGVLSLSLVDKGWKGEVYLSRYEFEFVFGARVPQSTVCIDIGRQQAAQIEFLQYLQNPAYK